MATIGVPGAAATGRRCVMPRRRILLPPPRAMLPILVLLRRWLEPWLVSNAACF